MSLSGLPDHAGGEGHDLSICEIRPIGGELTAQVVEARDLGQHAMGL